jgi:hypothetical protein
LLVAFPHIFINFRALFKYAKHLHKYILLKYKKASANYMQRRIFERQTLIPAHGAEAYSLSHQCISVMLSYNLKK